MREPQFHRIRRLPPYVFSEVNTMKAAARAEGRDIIDFGMGNPDAPTPAPIVEKLIEAIRDPRTHRYSTSRGIPGLRRAQAAYYGRRFGVDLDPETEIVVTLGSKEGLANLAQAITAPGDVILAPNPSYPIHPYGFIIAGAAIRHVPVVPGGDIMAELARAVQHSVPPPTAMVLNFPSNPTAQVVDLDFYQRGGRLRPPARDLHPVRHRLCRDLFRGAAALDFAGAGRQGGRGRVQLAQQDLQHAGLADRLRRRQSDADRRAHPDQVLSRLWRLHPDSGGGVCCLEWLAGLRRGDAHPLSRAP